MDPLVKQIHRQASKIIRILNRIAQQTPAVSRELDLAIYAAIQIEKNATKYAQNAEGIEGQDHLQGQTNSMRDQMGREAASDPVLDAAWANIESFKQSTFKLESKINVLINESQTHPRHHPAHIIPNNPLHPHKVKPSKPSKHSKPSKYPRPDTQDSHSRSMSQIDHSIIRISNQITTLIGPGRPAKTSRNQSSVEEYQG